MPRRAAAVKSSAKGAPRDVKLVRADVAVTPVSWTLVPGTKTALIRLDLVLSHSRRVPGAPGSKRQLERAAASFAGGVPTPARRCRYPSPGRS